MRDLSSTNIPLLKPPNCTLRQFSDVFVDFMHADYCFFRRYVVVTRSNFVPNDPSAVVELTVHIANECTLPKTIMIVD